MPAQFGDSTFDLMAAGDTVPTAGIAAGNPAAGQADA
jgi:hypothetical protein